MEKKLVFAGQNHFFQEGLFSFFFHLVALNITPCYTHNWRYCDITLPYASGMMDVVMPSVVLWPKSIDVYSANQGVLSLLLPVIFVWFVFHTKDARF